MSATKSPTPPGRTYLVGGAVRDRLLGLPVKERDWVVVGATPEAMAERGFRPVGREFPVFLHPETGEEYALARTERKVAAGYHGFTFHASPAVTLEQDLARRDLTINAMAEDPQGRRIDPYGGERDLAERRLRHVSPAFREDPVRILRLARFAARFHRLGFAPSPDTLELCREMVAAGEVDALVPERVWQELARALMEAVPSAFFRVLRDCGALARLLPELDRLFGVPQPPRHHPEVDSGEHVLLALDQAARLEAPLAVRYAVLTHDFGKAETPPEELPRHRGHEERGVPLAEAVSERLQVPKACRELARLVTRYHMHGHRLLKLRPASIVRLLERLDAFRRPERVDGFLLACEADARGRTGFEDRPFPQAACLRAAYDACKAVDPRPFVEQGLRGPEIAEAVHEARVRAVAAVNR
ncbi:multifunctional CCA addition/repair protein [Sediminicurvatus halobius]|uniref:Multifunctional CCA protein n=1 Tax=Sediminicurvatus halobius TaxID=2182432 RepID=A0A2U2N749_9GAMM|nr:multifunctional CCA addition/repair protein [Spiribacter halobius]PWG64918.1 multifunctional CCA addition/repair protein [Spiribacter halobius]UEX78225.1 multifunctional CCA addition/repair protein [Spiribacter halobius]